MRNITLFKIRRVYLFTFLLLFIFLLAPLSLHKFKLKVEDFLNDYAILGVKKFEKQTGLKIEWESLKFQLFTMSVHLNDVKIRSILISNSKNFSSIEFLDGLQNLKKISSRPSLYHLIFKNQIILSKVQIHGGELYLKTTDLIYKKNKISKKFIFPVRRLFIKQVGINIKHKDQHFHVKDSFVKIWKNSRSVFQFNLVFKKMHIKDLHGFKDFSNMREKKGLLQNFEDSFFQLSTNGFLKPGHVFFKDMILKNNTFQSFTEKVDVLFDSKGIQQASFKSSGVLPFVLLRKGFAFVNWKLPLFDSHLSYDLDIQYKKQAGYQGTFEFQGESIVLKNYNIKKFLFKGQLKKSLITVNHGFIETLLQGNIKVRKGKWFLTKNPYKFNFFIDVEKLSFDFLSSFMNFKKSIFRGDFTGSINCFGINVFSNWSCQTKGFSQKIVLQTPNQKKLVSFHKVLFETDLQSKNENFKIAVFDNNKKEDFKFKFHGEYSKSKKVLFADFSFSGNLSQDIKFYLPFSNEGKFQTTNGKLSIKKDQLQLSGMVFSPFLSLNSYNLKEISSFYQYKENQLKFFNFKGQSGNTNYTAICDIDFRKKELFLKVKVPFFDIKDILEFKQEPLSLPFDIKATGSASFFIHYPWIFPQNKKFHVTGNLFNIFLHKDFFQQADFNFGIQEDQKGVVQSISLKKGNGFIKAKGVFDQNFSLNLDIVGENLSLERFEWINDLFPFNQSGDIQFQFKLQGSLFQPRLVGDLFFSNVFLYTDSVKDSHLKVQADKKRVFVSGQFLKEIYIKEFIYPFSKQKSISISGEFKKFNLIRFFLSKYSIQNIGDYFSSMDGLFALSRKKTSDLWTGFVKIDDLLISRFNKWIKNKNVFSIFFNKNSWSVTPIDFFYHNKKYLKIQKKNLNQLVISGEIFLDLLSGFFPFFKVFEGVVKGELLVNNNIKKLNPKGVLSIEKGLLSLGSLPDFKNIYTDVVFSKKNIFIKDFKARSGGGDVTGQGVVIYDFINSPQLNLNLDFFNSRIHFPKDFKTKGSGSLNIKGHQPPYLIKGQYFIHSGVITKEFSKPIQKTKYNFSFLKEEQKKKNSIFDLEINIKTKEALSISSSLIQSSIEGQADIYGSLDALLINGRFNLSKDSEDNIIFFRGQEFKIHSGFIYFKNSKPENPYINVQASSLFKSTLFDPFQKGQEVEKNYKISLSLKGKTKKLAFSLKSDPFLSEKEIISLLTLGVNFDYFDSNVKQNIGNPSSKLLYSYQLLGSLLLEKPLNREIKHILGLDFRLTPYIDSSHRPVTKLTLSKNWFERWKTSFSQTIEEESQSDVRLKYSLNEKISLTAFWDQSGIENIETSQTEEEQNFIGLDLEFNFDF